MWEDLIKQRDMVICHKTIDAFSAKETSNDKNHNKEKEQ